ncbi:Oidioi.mRNA.OKI2018_I69.XSR.g13958.t1.cds [Oikopleura dioica]|uniref:Oidioi.mRNA.OKI2018_I69.XSR.g13958.t1.cds n=1 Tax=Oikopleura dioica TaxID=34765 RepID=A0ABN7S8X6_OIKDI|nr:Oidioi.mRNA.OKI2018_I69.XSR.g13958.t1.cds [Oikopleura dioica]
MMLPFLSFLALQIQTASAQTHRLVVKTEVKTKAFSKEADLPNAVYFDDLFNLAVNECELEGFEMKSNETESFGDTGNKLWKMTVDVDFTAYSMNYIGSDCLRRTVEKPDEIIDLKVLKEVRIFDETESIVIGTFSSIGFLIILQGFALANKFSNILKATLMTVGQLVFYTVAGSLVYFMYQDDTTAVDLKVGWGIIGGTAGFLLLILIVVSFLNRSSVSSESSENPKKRVRRRQRRNSNGSSSSSSSSSSGGSSSLGDAFDANFQPSLSVYDPARNSEDERKSRKNKNRSRRTKVYTEYSNTRI